MTRADTAPRAGEGARTQASREPRVPASTPWPRRRTSGLLHSAPTAAPVSAHTATARAPARAVAVESSPARSPSSRATAAAAAPASSAPPRPVSRAAGWTRTGPAAAAAQSRAASGSPVTQIRTSQTADGTRPAAA
ncbi:hypothetical protein WKI68_11115 [Streptomyces sp. MS1.HAVA.3]|uniref:Uncharacterized protein n=1 Tax=Streptomyces caledonius TaxID=3134107 RepID=A0ABU8U1V5_9ACTN